jgi:hypothetical protein
MTATASSVSFESPADHRDLLSGRHGNVRFIDVPRMRHLAVDGTGAPGGDEFREAFGVLYPVAYTLHFALRARGVSAPVGALEGLWWIGREEPIPPAAFVVAGPDGTDESGAAAPVPVRPWTWRLMLQVPPEAAGEEIDAAIAEVERKKSPPALGRLHALDWTEGPSAQILHVGPYDAEPATIEALHRAIADAGLVPRGCHHEIYLGDPNRSAPARLKTILRQPVEPADRTG